MICGDLGVALDVFYKLTPREFANISKGIYQKRNADFKNHWEQTRTLMFSVSAPHLKNKNAKPEDILKFPWEKTDADIDLQKEIEQVEKQMDFWEKYDQRKKTLN